MGKQAKAKQERREGGGSLLQFPVSNDLGRELALKEANKRQEAEMDRVQAARRALERNLDPAVTERVAAVRAVLETPAFNEARNTALNQARLSLRPPQNEDDVREVLLGVLRAEPFNCDTRDVLLKLFVYAPNGAPCPACLERGRKPQRERHFHVMCFPGVEAVQRAAEAARAELEAPKLSETSATAG